MTDKVLIDCQNKPDGWTITPWTSGWFAPSPFERTFSKTFRGSIFTRRYGGDLQGIIDHLDYLEDLGIDGLYLTPVFESVSLHKYDASMYHHIDINFGPDPIGDQELIAREDPADPATWQFTAADKLFLKLVKLVHDRGMHIIIDGVFNHTGVHFWAFQDIVKNGKKSIFVRWYKIRSFLPTKSNNCNFTYDSWWNISSLPLLNRDDTTMHPDPKKHVFDITRRWMDPDDDGDPSDGIDGWRLDVPRDLPIGFWREWSTLVKSINISALLTGELWELSPDFVAKDGPFDSLMNYDFARAIDDFFVAKKTRVSASRFIEALQTIERSYPDNLYFLFNLLDSHDIERVASLVINPDRKFNTDKDESNPKYNPRKPTDEEYELIKLLVAFQMTCKGAPMIYYGDEVGMWGAHDPHCRKPMLWDDLTYDDEIIDATSGFHVGFGRYSVVPNAGLRAFYKEVIKLRKGSNALLYGNMEYLPVKAGVDAIGFIRRHDKEVMIAMFNIDKYDVKINVPVDFEAIQDALTGEMIELPKEHPVIILKSGTFKILRVDPRENAR
ncbi:MAG TPA: glycoside hydrolase family 13 protein [Candidatus Lokiarchaeia archaeon]|nr:glycoside hydrolase family 13 protein [Candidatus Lokiarchaeia archaeon]